RQRIKRIQESQDISRKLEMASRAPPGGAEQSVQRTFADAIRQAGFALACQKEDPDKKVMAAARAMLDRPVEEGTLQNALTRTGTKLSSDLAEQVDRAHKLTQEAAEEKLTTAREKLAVAAALARRVDSWPVGTSRLPGDPVRDY